MMNALLTAAALLSSAVIVSADSNVAAGRAIVVNKCNFPVWVKSIAAALEGGTDVDGGAIQPGQSFSQHFTGLSGYIGGELKHDGWSIKISKTEDGFYNGGQLFQYEYTYQPTIDAAHVWLDLSSVDGTTNAFLTDGWNIQTTKDCSSGLYQKHTYMYSKDDSFGMQPECPSDADLTVTLCEWDSSSSSSSSPAPSSSPSSTTSAGNLVASVFNGATSALGGLNSAVFNPAPTTTSALTTQAAPTTHAAPTTTAAPAASPAPAAPAVPAAPVAAASAGGAVHAGADGRVMEDNVAVHNAAAPTTFATVASSKPTDIVYKTEGSTVTEIAVAWVTNYITVDGPEATPEVKKRHVHHRAAHHE